jgi:hypothetical protein
MIEFRFEEERQIAIYYAKQIGDEVTLTILNNGVVQNAEEAVHLRIFFWNMVDLSVEDEKQKKEVPGYLKRESIMEGIMQSFRRYLISNGYESEWSDDD